MSSFIKRMQGRQQREAVILSQLVSFQPCKPGLEKRSHVCESMKESVIVFSIDIYLQLQQPTAKSRMQ
jgi:hypothetical protein